MTSTTTRKKNTAVEAALQAAPVATVPLSKLAVSPFNVRAVPEGQDSGIDALAANIMATGLLQNLVVHSLLQGSDVVYGVAAGQRRMRALLQLLASGRIAADYPVPVKIVADDIAVLVSLSENALRQDMHPADQIAAFARLVHEGSTVDLIATSFGVSAAHVTRLLKLADMAPSLLVLLRENRITLEQLKALALAPDHATQEAVWAAAVIDWMQTPPSLRSAVTRADISVTDVRVAWVGLEQYMAAGGTLRQDLFATEDKATLQDSALLNRLYQDKLKDLGESLKAEGWSWVEIHPQERPSSLHRYEILSKDTRERTPEEQARNDELVEALNLVSNRIAELEGSDEEPDEEEMTRYQALNSKKSEIQSKIDLMEDARQWWGPLALAAGGVVVHPGYRADEPVCILRGLRHPDALRVARQAAENPDATVTVSAGAARCRRPVHSDRLTRSITRSRTPALQTEVLASPNVALTLLVHRMACDVYGFGMETHALRVSLRAVDLNPEQDETAPPEWRAMAAAQEKWKGQLPDNFRENTDWLAAWPQTRQLEFLAFLTACSINTVQEAEDSRYDAGAWTLAARATKLDMTRYWQADAAQYLNHVSKERIIDVVAIAVSPDAALPLAKLKKGEAANRAAILLAETGWLPDMLVNAPLDVGDRK